MLVARIAFTVLVSSLALAACHRKVEPYDPNEKVEQPDLSTIFPEGAERAASQAPSEMPPAPGEAPRGAPAVEGMTAPENAGPPLTGTIALASGAEVPSGATLFVIARVGEAGPPTAVLRKKNLRLGLPALGDLLVLQHTSALSGKHPDQPREHHTQ